jgi:hypothetical protein
MTKAKNPLTPTQLAAELAGDDNATTVAKAFVRPFLRKNFTREVKGTAWYLTDDQVKAVREAYAARQAGKA